jgi:hypothetical protein
LVFYNANKLNQQRLHQLRVDLKHLPLPVRILAPVFLADKLIRLHKLRHPIVFKNLWMALPFDENMDKDIEDLIDARIARHIADLENRGEPLNLNTLSDVIRSSQAIKKKIYDQPPPIAHAGDALAHRQRRGSTDQDDSVDVGRNPSDHAASNGVSRDASRPPQSVVIQGSSDVHVPISSRNHVSPPAEKPGLATPLNQVVVHHHHERSRPPSQGPRAERSRPPPQPQPVASEPHLSDASSSTSSHAYSSEKTNGSRLAALVKLSRSSALRVSSSSTPPLSTFTARSSHAPAGLSSSAAFQPEIPHDVSLELDVISPSHQHEQPAAAAVSASTPLTALHSPQSHYVAPEPPRSRSRSVHRPPTTSTAAASASPVHSTGVQEGPSAAKVGKIQLATLSPASRAPQSMAHHMGTHQPSIPQSPPPPPSHSKSRARVADDATSSAGKAGTVQNVSAAAAADSQAPFASTAQPADTAARARLREHARSQKHSSQRPKDGSPPPLTLVQRLRAAGAELEEC